MDKKVIGILIILGLAEYFTVDWYNSENVTPVKYQNLTKGFCPIIAHDIDGSSNCGNSDNKYDGIIIVSSPVNTHLINRRRVIKCIGDTEEIINDLDVVYPINSTDDCFYNDNLVQFKGYSRKTAGPLIIVIIIGLAIMCCLRYIYRDLCNSDNQIRPSDKVETTAV